jgi:steroid delta-isomerase-like uncharacterized protein
MSVERNEAAIRRLVDEVFSKGSLDAIDELFADEVVFHRVGDGQPIPNARRRIRLFITAYRTAFPDLKMQVDELIASEEAVTVCWTAEGTNTGPLSQPEVGAFGVPPTGRSAKWSGISLYRLENGRIITSRSYANGYALLRQLGLISGLTPPSAPPAGGSR